MKWPLTLTLVRHGQSTYNELRQKKQQDPEYQEFRQAFALGPSDYLRRLARNMRKKFALGVSDYTTPLSPAGIEQGSLTGRAIEQDCPQPDVIIVSPYLRTRQTLDAMKAGGFRVQNTRIVIDDRIREQEHGLSLLYNDWRVFQTFHPEQRELYELLGPYWYQYPQGESVSNVRDRIRSFTATLIREYAGCHIMLITHHLTILSIRTNFERLSPEEFIRLDEEEKPINCGVTAYRGDAQRGSNGKLGLVCYNQKWY